MSKHSIFDETEVPNPFEEDIDDVGESRVLTEKDLLLKEIFEFDINVAERIVFLESAIRKSAAGYILKRVGIIKKFSGDDESPVTLHVSSYGGDAYGMLAAIDAINMSTIPINTIGVGPIMSAASGILAAGTGEADCDLTIEMFKRTFDALGIEYLGAVTSKAYDIGDAEKDQKALNEIQYLAAKINADDDKS